MPPAGHADLARAYLRRGQAIEARPVLSMATIIFGLREKLAALLCEANRRDTRRA